MGMGVGLCSAARVFCLAAFVLYCSLCYYFEIILGEGWVVLMLFWGVVFRCFAVFAAVS